MSRLRFIVHKYRIWREASTLDTLWMEDERKFLTWHKDVAAAERHMQRRDQRTVREHEHDPSIAGVQRIATWEIEEGAPA